MFGRTQLPSALVVTRTVASASPTKRSASTVAPATGPAGPSTEPVRAASPGPIETGAVVGVPATVASCTPSRPAGRVCTVAGGAGGCRGGWRGGGGGGVGGGGVGEGQGGDAAAAGQQPGGAERGEEHGGGAPSPSQGTTSTRGPSTPALRLTGGCQAL